MTFPRFGLTGLGFTLLVSLCTYLARSEEARPLDPTLVSTLAAALPPAVAVLVPGEETPEGKLFLKALAELHGLKDTKFFKLPEENGKRPKMIRGKKPRAVKEDAKCDLMLLIDPKGRVVSAYVLSMDDPQWMRNCMAILGTMEFEPATYSGKPVPILVYQPMKCTWEKW